MSLLVSSLKRPWRVLLGVAVAAALNCFPVDLVGDAHFSFGVLLAMPFVLALAPNWAVVVGLVAAWPRLVVGHEPVLFTIGACEAVWLATIARRRRSFVLTDLLFWFFIGVPGGLGLYVGVARLSLDVATVLVVNQALNSLVAVIVAEWVVRSTWFCRWLGLGPLATPGLRDLIFNVVFAVAALPLVLMAFGLSVLLRTSAAQRDRAHLAQSLTSVSRQLDLDLSLHQAAIVTIAGALDRGARAPSMLLEQVRRAYPSFVTLITVDAVGRIQGTAPHQSQLTGFDVSNRDYFRLAESRRAPVISGVFRGKGFGHDILVGIAAPRFDPKGQFVGVVEGSLEVHRLGAVIAASGIPSDVSMIVADATGRVVSGDAALGLRPLQRIADSAFAPLLQADSDGLVLTVDREANDGVVERLHAQAVRARYGFTVIACRSVAAGISEVVVIYLLLGAIVAGALALAIWLADLASRRLALPLEHFARDVVDQAESGEVVPMMEPVAGLPREIAMVFAAFNCLAERVIESYSALRRTNAELDARVAERTRELQAAQQRAEAASQSKTEFVAMTGHEIRTPLNAIIGLADVLAQELPPGRAVGQVRTIHQAGTGLLRVVNDLLDLSQIEAGKLEIKNEPVELGAVVDAVITLFRPQAVQKRLTLTAAVEVSRPLWVATDGARLQQVLINLVGNALKFTGEGGVRVEVSIEAESQENVTLRFNVSDTGPGISIEQQARLFQPYVRLSGQATEQTQGSGLGLAISRRLVALLGGKLEVRSSVGRGSEFHFTTAFPRAAAKAEIPAVGAMAQLAGLRILVVDDHVANQEVLRTFLERAEARVETVASVQAALARLEGESFDAALVDLEMPEEGGERLVQLAVQDPAIRLRSGVLIAVSAHTRDEMLAECRAQGFDDYLAKPVDRHELYRLLQRHVAERRSRAVAV